VNQTSRNTFIELEQLILHMGYDETTSAMVVAFLKTQNRSLQQKNELEAALTKVNDFVEKKLKPRYLPSSLNRLLALIDITIEHDEATIYFIKQLFNPDCEAGRMRIVYAYMRYIATDRYELAYLQPNGEYQIVHQSLKLKDCLKVLETDPLFEP
jgi:hypothetical protein